MVLGSPTIVGAKKIYDNQPEIFCEKYFYHDLIFYHVGKKRFYLIMEVRHRRLPKGFTSKYTHKDIMYTNEH